MDNLNISYAEGWKNAQDIAHYESVNENDTVAEPEVVKKRKIDFPLLTTVQIIISVLCVLAAFVIKQLGSDIYTEIKKVYDENINNEIILKGSFESFTLNTVPDEAES